MSESGPVRKMHTRSESPVAYSLPLGKVRIPLNERLGQRIRLEFTGAISCTACDRSIHRTFNGGYCFPCSRSLPAADSCMVKPETCHYAAGTCRDASWGEAQCMRPHTVYLANSSGLKVGITRGLDPVGRWIDQGACQGLAIREVGSRLESGQVEVALRQFVSDRTDWRRMLKGEPEPIDLAAHRDRILALYEKEHPGEPLPGASVPAAPEVSIQYPVLEYPEKVRPHNLDKEPVLEGTLLGIKGQYLLLDTAVLNVRKVAGYHLRLG